MGRWIENSVSFLTSLSNEEEVLHILEEPLNIPK